MLLVSGTNGKTTTSHLLADGAVAALAAAADAEYAVLEVDEWHLAAVARAVRPAVVVLLNLTRDQLDRGSEVRAVGAAVGGALATGRSSRGHPGIVQGSRRGVRRAPDEACALRCVFADRSRARR